MGLHMLRDDALKVSGDGFALRVSLPWIRSLPLWAVSDVALAVDGEPVPLVTMMIGERTIPASALRFERGWWFVQDRLVLSGRRRLEPGRHDVALSLHLIVPYLQAGPDGPLTLPFREERALMLGALDEMTVSRDVA